MSFYKKHNKYPSTIFTIPTTSKRYSIYYFQSPIQATMMEYARQCCMGGIVFATVDETPRRYADYVFTIYAEIAYEDEICIEDKEDILAALKDRTGVARLRYYTMLPIQVLDDESPMSMDANIADREMIHRFIKRVDKAKDDQLRLYVPEILDYVFRQKGKVLPPFKGRKRHRWSNMIDEIFAVDEDTTDGEYINSEEESEDSRAAKLQRLTPPEHGMIAIPPVAHKPSYTDIGAYERTLRKKIRWFIDTHAFTDFCEAIEQSVIGQEELRLVLINIWSYLTCIGKNIPAKNNVIIAAPSGCGKTETYRAVKQYFIDNCIDIPIAQIDMTSITEEGYTGGNTVDFLRPLFDDFRTNGIGLIFMDELDKKLVPSYSSHGDVNLAVQSQLLTVIEGAVREDKNSNKINTCNTMFIGLGAFNQCREKKKNKASSIGFNAEVEIINHYEHITRQDMIDVGGSYELLGRFSQIINYHKLDKGAVKLIIKKYLDSLSTTIDLPIILESKAVEELCDEANGAYGCRLIGSMLTETIMRCYQEILSSGVDTSETVIVVKEAKKSQYKMI